MYTTDQNPKAVLLKLECAPESYGDYVKNADSDSGGLGCSLRFRFSNRLPGDAMLLVLGLHLRNTALRDT